MVQRGMIRAGVAFNRTHYVIDRGQQRGIAYEGIRSFEEQIDATGTSGSLKTLVAFVPLPPDRLWSAPVDGRVDLVAAQLTVTPDAER